MARNVYRKRNRTQLIQKSRRSRLQNLQRLGRFAAFERLEERTLLAGISGVVFDDANANRSQDTNEPGIAGITVYLDANNNSVFETGEVSRQSASDGSYAFENLADGDYVVRQVVPANSQQTTPTGAGRLFATTFAGTISAIELDPVSGNILNSFALPGSPTAPPSHTQGLAFEGESLFYYENNAKILYELNADSGAVLNSYNFAAAFANRNIGGLTSLNGQLYMLDITSNATRALIAVDLNDIQNSVVINLGIGFNFGGGLASLPNENLLVAGTSSTLLFYDTAGRIVDRALINSSLAPSGLAVVGDEIFVTYGGSQTQVLDRDGNVLRSYNTVAESYGLAGGAGDGGAHFVALTGQDATNRNFGNQSTLAGITGTKFEDLNGNGQRDQNEPGLPGVTIYLDLNRNGVMDSADISTVTAADGSFALTNLAAGDYIVREVVPNGYRQTTQGNDPGTYYGAAYIVGTGQMNYVEIDALTGDVDRIGDPLSARMHGLVRTNAGEFYGVNGGGTDRIYRLNPNDGSLTLVGPTGYEMTFGLAYDALTDTIYGVGKPSLSDDTNYLLEVDRTDGSVTQIGSGYVGLVSTSALAFDAESRRVIAFDNNDDEFVAFELDGTATQLADLANMSTFSLTDAPEGLVFGGLGTTTDSNGNVLRETIRKVDLQTGVRSTILKLSEAAPLESLDWANDTSQYRFLLGTGEQVNDVIFGNALMNRSPVADAGGAYAIDEGASLPLDAGNSSDPDGDTLTFAWDLDNNGTFGDVVGATTELSWQQLASFGITDDGIYPIAVQVSDGELAATDEVFLAVRTAAPSNILLSVDPTSINENGTTTLAGSFEDPSTNDTHEVLIRWGDGSTSTVSLTQGERSFAASHRYLDDGAYVPTVEITDDDGRKAFSGNNIVDKVALDFDQFLHTENGISIDTVTEDGFFLDYPDHQYASFLAFGANHGAFPGSPALATQFEGQNIELTQVGGAPFNAVSIDLSELSPNLNVHSPATVTFRGLRTDGLYGVDTFTTTADDEFGFETFYFDSDFTDLVSLTWSSGTTSGKSVHQFDNIVLETAASTTNNPAVTVNNVAPSNLVIELAPEERDEYGNVTMNLTWDDPGTPDVHTVLLDWADGTDPQELTLRAGRRDLEVTHYYGDSGTFAVTATVADDDGGSGTVSRDLVIHNSVPHIRSVQVLPGTLDEGGTVQLNVGFSDFWFNDTFTADIDWGDGTTSEISLAARTVFFSATHQYLDDDPTGTRQDDYTINVTVTDDEGASDTETESVTVRNVAPEILSITSTAAGAGETLPGQTVSITATFSDIGTLDTHTAVIDWGDGTTSPCNIERINATDGIITDEHTYTQAGIYTPWLRLEDDDRGSAVAFTTAFVSGVRTDRGVLQIVGTGADNNVSITSHRKHGALVKADFLSGRGEPIDPASITSIEVFLGTGDDRFTIDDSFTQSLLVMGGAGADRISAGGGRSLLIGGPGADRLGGGSNQDIQIAGTTDFDNNVSALRSILAEWNSARSLQERVSNLFDGSGSANRLNGDNFLTVGSQGTVHNDAAGDTVQGSGDRDWLFHDSLLDRLRGKVRDDIFANELDDLLGG